MVEEKFTESGQGGTGLSPKWIADGSVPKASPSSPFQTAKQAQEIALVWEQANKDRVARAAAIQADYDGAPPIPKSQLINRAEAWRSNLNFGFLSGLVDSSVSRMLAPITSARYLSYATLPDVFPDNLTKTQAIRAIFTDTVRAWDGFANFYTQLAKEVNLHGYAAAAFLDPITWRPEFYRSTDILVANESPQVASDHAVIYLKKDWLPFELVEKIKNAEEAGLAGWNIEGCVDALNSATSKSNGGAGDDARTYQDWVRDGNFFDSHTTGNKVVPTWIVFVKEYDNTVSQWVVSRDTSNTKELFYVKSRFQSMSDAVVFLTLESGNGTLHGTKGIGRILGPQSSLMNRTWNKLMDQLAMSTAKILKTDPKNPRPILQVNGSFVYVDREVDVEPSGFASDISGPMAVLQTLVQSAQQRAGAFISGQLDQRENKTAREVTIAFQREQESTIAFQTRFEQQMAQIFTAVQKRIFSDAVIKEAKRNIRLAAEYGVKEDEDGVPIAFEPKSDIVDHAALVAAYRVLQAGISVQELKTWRQISAARDANREEANAAQGLSGFLELAKFPQFAQFVDWRAVFKTAAAQTVGADLANELILPTEDTANKTQAQRQQLLENVAIMGGVQVPVLPSDAHQYHMETILGAVDGLLEKYSREPSADLLNDALGLMEHFDLHLQAASAANPPAIAKDQLKQFAEIAKQIHRVIGETVARSEAQAAQNEEVMNQVAQPVDPAQAVPLAAPEQEAQESGAAQL